MKLKKIRLLPFVFFCITGALVVNSCTDSKETKAFENLDDLEVLVPEKLQEFDHIDSLYYSYLGINSFATSDGGFILPVWDPAAIVKTNSEGNEVLATTKQGRGPRELLDVGRPTAGEDVIYVYDQFQTKIVLLNRDDLSLIKEVLPESYKEYRISRVYPSFVEGKVLIEMSKSQLIIDEINENLLIRFDLENGGYEESIVITGKPYAPLGDLINGRAGSAVMVPFSDDQFIVPAPERRTILLYDTRTDLIAEVNADFDTLHSISVDLPVEEVTSVEIDSIKVSRDISNEEWKYVEPYLPQTKAKADDMLFHNEKIWLKSNLQGEGDIWYILDMEGEITDLVRLPKNSFLTHVSNNHLGVRLDDVTFALFTNPRP